MLDENFEQFKPIQNNWRTTEEAVVTAKLI
jgi:hypothetical protein